MNIVMAISIINAIAALNWGLSVFYKMDLVKSISKALSIKKLDRVLYGIIGLSGLIALVGMFQPALIANMFGMVGMAY